MATSPCEEIAMDLDIEEDGDTGDSTEVAVERLTIGGAPPVEKDKKELAELVATGKYEDGECSSLSDTDGTDMEVDTGILADNESSPMSKHSKSKFQRPVSKFVSSESNRRRGSSGNVLPLPDRGPRQYTNPYLSEEAKKRAIRAQRFHDSPYKFTSEVEQPCEVSEAELLNLYKMCGLLVEDWGEILSLEKVAPQYRLDSILIRGINNMSTDEIFSYLYEIGLVPQSMEWVNDACCIAVYKDKEEAAASLLKVTKPISVDHEGMEKKKNLEIDEKPLDDDDEDKDKSIDEKNENLEPLDYEGVNVIPYDKVQVPMPLGYVWRYARPCEKAKGILMRYATTSDRKQEQAERHSEYYKKYGNPNRPFDMDEEGPRRKKPFKRVRYNPSPEPSSSEEEIKHTVKLNVWSKLSADWQSEEGGNDRRGGASAGILKKEPIARANTPIPRFTVPPASAGLFTHHHHNRDWEHGSSSFKKHTQRYHSVFDKLDSPHTRKRIWRQDERSEKQLYTANHDSDEEWTARLKGPTMRMHADLEESRQKLHANRKRNLANQGITSRLGERVQVDFEQEHDFTPPPRRSVKDRLGSKLPSYGSRNNGQDRAQDYDEEEEDLQSLIQND